MGIKPRLLALAKKSRLPLLLTLLLGLIGGLLIITQAQLLTRVIQRVFLENANLRDVWGILQILLGVILLRAAAAWLQEGSAKAVALRVKSDLRKHLLEHIEHLGPAYTKGERSGELTTTLVEGIEALDAYFSQYLPQLVLAALIPFSILVFVFPLDLLSGIILLVTGPLIPFFMILVGKSAEALTGKQYRTLTLLSAHFLDSLQGLTTLKIFNRGREQIRTIADASEQFRKTTLRVLRVTFLSALILELLATLSTAIIAVEVGLRLLYGRMVFEQAFYLLVIAPEFYIPMRMLGLRFHAGMEGVSASRRIFEILDTPLPEYPRAENTASLPGTFTKITLDHVSFTYPGGDTPALDQFSIMIRAGEKIALVGRSGAGKSTLAGLLLGFLAPTQGMISVDGVSLSNHGIQNWREQVAWVPQDPYLFHTTILENLLIARPDASQAEISSALRSARLDGWIASLPGGLNTLVGEEGLRLSGGQAQRLALARAFLKDAPLLILDEPTSSLDPELESELNAAVRELTGSSGSKKRTVITIAHRLNTVYQADRILVLDKGKLVELGRHDDLILTGGIYASFIHSGQDLAPVPMELPSSQPSRRPPGEPCELDHSPGEILPQQRGIIQRLLGFLRGSWGHVALSVLLGTITIGSSISLLGSSAWLISAAALQPSIAELSVAIVGVRFFGITRGIARYAERLVSHNVTFRLLSRLRTWFYAVLEPLAPARLMKYRGGDLLSRVIADVETLENFYVRGIAPPLVALLITAGTGIYLATYHLSLGIILVIFMLGAGVGVPLLTGILAHRPGRERVRLAGLLNEHLVSWIQGLPDLLAFGQVQKFRAAISAVSLDSGRIQQRLAWIRGLDTGLGELLSNLAVWAVLVTAVPMVSAGEIRGVNLAVLCLITLAAFEAVTPLPLAAQMLSSTRQAAQRLFEVVDSQPEIVDPPAPHPNPPDFKHIQFNKLSFSYEEGILPALREITFQIENGKHTAVVGPSGAGKTTLVNLLLRFWDYQEGEILLNGVDLRSYKARDVRSWLSLVSQNPYFFNASIAENIRISRPGAECEDVKIAAKRARIHDFIITLPGGYGTLIGEKGLRLSAGQRRRLAIARAFLRNTPFLLLDEPTANLDPGTESEILSTLISLLPHRTTMLITHRLVGLDYFDEILVLDRGQIVERGLQQELIDARGLFWRMWDSQQKILQAV